VAAVSEFHDVLRREGYKLPRQLADGRWLAIQKLLYTVGLVLIEDGDTVGWRCRWCYESVGDAYTAWSSWDGAGDDPGGPWVKQKGRASTGTPVDRLNPRLADPESDF